MAIKIDGMDLLQIVKDTTATFSHYRQGYAYYVVEVGGDRFSFPVQLSDIGAGTLLATHRTIELMRYVRRALEDQTFVSVA